MRLMRSMFFLCSIIKQCINESRNIMRKFPAKAAITLLLTTAFAAGTLAGCTLNNPFSSSAPETLQDSGPAVVVSDAELLTPVPESRAEELVTSTPTPTPTPKPTPIPTIAPVVLTPTPVPEKDLKVLGEASEEETTFKTIIGNGTGQNIVRLAVRVRSDGYDTAEYLSTEEPMVPNERMVLYYDASYAIREAKQYGDIPEYQIRFTTADGNEYILHNIPFGETEEMTIMAGRGYAFITYTQTSDHAEMSSEADERAYYGISDDEPLAAEAAQSGSSADAGSSSADNSGNSSGSSEDSSDNSGGNQSGNSSEGSGNNTDYDEGNDDNGGDDYDNNDNNDNNGGDTEDYNEGDDGDNYDYEDDGAEYGEDNIDTYEEEDVEYHEEEYDEEGNVVG